MNGLKILNLVLYSPSSEYDEMYKILREFYTVDTYFYHYSEEIDTDYVLDGDRLIIRGKESYLPGILNKTISAIKYFNDNGLLKEYNYIVRSNCSTLIDFNRLSAYLTENPIAYGGGCAFKLEWLHEEAGIVDQRYWGTRFASGTSIILSLDAVEQLLSNEHLLDRNIIDDVAIGILLNSLSMMPVSLDKYFVSVPQINQITISDITSGRWWFYRNKQHDRDKGEIRRKSIAHMRCIADILKANKGG